MMNADEQEKMYQTIMNMYDHTESVIDMVEFGDIKNREAHIPLVEHLVDDVEQATEYLAQMFIQYVETKRKFKGMEKQKVEKAYEQLMEAFCIFMEQHKELQN